MHEIIAAHCDGGHRLFLRFDDGAEGVVDLAGRIDFSGVFAPLRDPAAFASVELNADLGSVTWPTGADLCPDVLHAWLTGQDILPAAAQGTLDRVRRIG